MVDLIVTKKSTKYVKLPDWKKLSVIHDVINNIIYNCRKMKIDLSQIQINLKRSVKKKPAECKPTLSPVNLNLIRVSCFVDWVLEITWK